MEKQYSAADATHWFEGAFTTAAYVLDGDQFINLNSVTTYDGSFSNLHSQLAAQEGWVQDDNYTDNWLKSYFHKEGHPPWSEVLGKGLLQDKPGLQS